jgi:hypothetical protein
MLLINRQALALAHFGGFFIGIGVKNELGIRKEGFLMGLFAKLFGNTVLRLSLLVAATALVGCAGGYSNLDDFRASDSELVSRLEISMNYKDAYLTYLEGNPVRSLPFHHTINESKQRASIWYYGIHVDNRALAMTDIQETAPDKSLLTFRYPNTNWLRWFDEIKRLYPNAIEINKPQ